MHFSTKTVFLLFFIGLICQIPATNTFGQSQTPDVKLRFGKGLQITAADSSMHLKVNFRIQSLFTTEGTLNSDSEWESKFMVRRARLKFGGWAVHPRARCSRSRWESGPIFSLLNETTRAAPCW